MTLPQLVLECPRPDTLLWLPLLKTICLQSNYFCNAVSPPPQALILSACHRPFPVWQPFIVAFALFPQSCNLDNCRLQGNLEPNLASNREWSTLLPPPSDSSGSISNQLYQSLQRLLTLDHDHDHQIRSDQTSYQETFYHLDFCIVYRSSLKAYHTSYFISWTYLGQFGLVLRFWFIF